MRAKQTKVEEDLSNLSQIWNSSDVATKKVVGPWISFQLKILMGRESELRP